MPLGSTNRLEYLVPDVRIRAEEFIRQMALRGRPVRITETARSERRQGELYSVGRWKPGAFVTHARPSTSLHEYGRAFDFTFYGPGNFAPESWWTLAGTVGESLGLRWGGRFVGFPDRPHFEL